MVVKKFSRVGSWYILSVSLFLFSLSLRALIVFCSTISSWRLATRSTRCTSSRRARRLALSKSFARTSPRLGRNQPWPSKATSKLQRRCWFSTRFYPSARRWVIRTQARRACTRTCATSSVIIIIIIYREREMVLKKSAHFWWVIYSWCVKKKKLTNATAPSVFKKYGIMPFGP